MIKKKITQILGIALLSATFVTSASPAFATASTSQASQDTVISDTASEKDGWVKNENGKWTFYRNGEMVKGMISPYPGVTYYFFADGTSATGWTEIDGQMYYFKANDHGDNGYYMARNQFVDGAYLNSNGIKETEDSLNKEIKNGWIPSTDGNIYYYDHNVMVTGWYNNSPSQKSYFHENGAAAKGWTEIGGQTYYFKKDSFGNGYYMVRSQFVDGYYLDINGVRHDDDSCVQRGWIQDTNGNWRYYDYDGALCTGFYNVGPGQTSYFDKETGIALSGWQEINGKEYYFKPGAKGFVMATNETIDGKYINSLGWVEDPAAAPNRGWVQDENGNWRYYNDEGVMYKGFTMFGPNRYFYFDEETGVSLSGWHEINGYSYYFKEDECGYKMAFNETIDGIYIDADGHAQK